MIGIVGYGAMVRPDTFESVQACQSKDITVRLLYAGNRKKAKICAIKSGIISEAEARDSQICMEGFKFMRIVAGHMTEDWEPVFNMENFAQYAPKIKVLFDAEP